MAKSKVTLLRSAVFLSCLSSLLPSIPAKMQLFQIINKLIHVFLSLWPGITQQEIITFIESQTDLWEKVSTDNSSREIGIIMSLKKHAHSRLAERFLRTEALGGGGKDQTRRSSRRLYFNGVTLQFQSSFYSVAGQETDFLHSQRKLF